MRKKWLSWVLVGLCLGLTLSTAQAQQAGDGARTSLIGQKLGGVYDVDSTFRVWRFGPTGIPYFEDGNRDRDFPLITQLFSGQNLLAGQTYSMITAVPSLQYTRAAIMLTWATAVAAPADTDSVRIAVRVYGTTSSTSSNWHLWTPLAVYTAGDTCETNGQVEADSTGTGRCLKPISFWVGRQPSTRLGMPANGFTPVIGAAAWIFDGTFTTATAKMIKIRKVPILCLRWGSANGVMLNLTDNAGAPCPFPYIRIEVTNLTRGQTLSNVEANLWPRVQ